MFTDILSLTKRSMALSVVATLMGAIGLGVVFYGEYFGTNSVVVASSPSNAQIRINGKDFGSTPVTLELKRGTYTVEASRSGYEPAQHAIYVSTSTTLPTLVNVQLLPQQGAPGTTQSPGITNTGKGALDNVDLLAEINKLKAAVMTNPEEAISLPLIREKIRVQEELAKALRDDLKEVKEQTKWYLGSMIAIVVGLLAVIATLFVAMRGKPNA